MCSNKMAYYMMDVAKEFDFHQRAIFLILIQLTLFSYLWSRENISLVKLRKICCWVMIAKILSKTVKRLCGILVKIYNYLFIFILGFKSEFSKLSRIFCQILGCVPSTTQLWIPKPPRWTSCPQDSLGACVYLLFYEKI